MPNTNIDLEQIPELQAPTVTDSVNHGLVDREAALTRKTSVTEKCAD
jgi:hypothetical protein